MRSRVGAEEKPVIPPPVRAAVTDTLTPENLDVGHLHLFRTALSNILDTEVAAFTFAQIIDGLPTFQSFTKFQWAPPGSDWPVRSHATLCEVAAEEYRAFRSSFDLLSLKFDPKIAALLFQPEKNKHPKGYDEWITEQHRLKAAGDEGYECLDVSPPVAFYHRWYLDYEQYPRGIQDVVGYWAEAKILGGVMLFDRGESGTECNEVFFHASLMFGPTTIFPPTHDQLENIIAFLTSENDTGLMPCPLPVEATELNRPRWDRYHATKYFNIFRNRYDSRLPSYFLSPDKYSSRDFPELGDEMWLMNHKYEVENLGVELDAARVAEVERSMKNITPSSPLYHDVDKKYT